MKYKPSKFIEVWREVFQDEEFLNLSGNATKLYLMLNELEHRYTHPRKGESKWFYRKDEDLAKDCKICFNTLRKAKKELLETKWVEMDYLHFIDKDTRKISKKKVTCYKLS